MRNLSKSLPGANTAFGARAGTGLTDWRGADLGARDLGAGAETGLRGALRGAALALSAGGSSGLHRAQTKLAFALNVIMTHLLW